MSAPKARSTLTNEVTTAKRSRQSLKSSEAVLATGPALAEAKITDYIRKVAAAAPPLDDEQQARLTALLHQTAHGKATTVAGVR